MSSVVSVVSGDLVKMKLLCNTPLLSVSAHMTTTLRARTLSAAGIVSWACRLVCGTRSYEGIRSATSSDIPGIVDLIGPLEQKGQVLANLLAAKSVLLAVQLARCSLYRHHCS